MAIMRILGIQTDLGIKCNYPKHDSKPSMLCVLIEIHPSYIFLDTSCQCYSSHGNLRCHVPQEIKVCFVRDYLGITGTGPCLRMFTPQTVKGTCYKCEFIEYGNGSKLLDFHLDLTNLNSTYSVLFVVSLLPKPFDIYIYVFVFVYIFIYLVYIYF